MVKGTHLLSNVMSLANILRFHWLQRVAWGELPDEVSRRICGRSKGIEICKEINLDIAWMR